VHSLQPTLALITHEALGPTLTGPAIRVLELARAVAPHVRAVLVTPSPGPDRGVPQRAYRFGDEASMRAAVADADVCLVQGFTLYKFPALAASDRPLVVDLYCPFHLENLERRRLVEPDADAREFASTVDRAVLLDQLQRGDFFICASDRQRDYWLGMLTACGRLDAGAYQADATASQLLAVVPFGIAEPPPVPVGPGLKGHLAGIEADDLLVLWGGSVTDWQDPITPIRAVARLRDRWPSLRLALPSGIPNPDLPPMAALARAREEAAALGLLGRHVIFFDWVPFEQRSTYLLEAVVGVSAHLPSLETRYAWRTRVLDYLWARLPVVCSRGDAIADLVEREGLGVTVEPGDEAGFADALDRLLCDVPFRTACRARIDRIVPSLAWSRAAAPLVTFCRQPRRTGRPLPAPTAPQSFARRAAAALGWRRGA
jgi:hypothetical protein